MAKPGRGPVASEKAGLVTRTPSVRTRRPDEERDVRAIDLFVRSDATQLSELVARVARGELTVDVAERVPLADPGSVHARAVAGTLKGKIIVVPGWA